MQNYKTTREFRQALEQRLKTLSLNENIPLDRLRRRVAFDRLLARLFYDLSKPFWLLKGGYAMELRFQNLARTTKDVDISVPFMPEATADKILELLQTVVAKDLNDGFSFLIGIAMSELDQAVYGGWRFPVESRLDNRTFTKFHLDVGVGDAVLSKPECQQGPDLLSFAGIPPAKVAMLPIDQQFAEKLHAYSLPREGSINSRTRDLVDLVLIIETGLPDREVIKKAIKATFERRNTHQMPTRLDPPPEIWRDSYIELAAECGVGKKKIEEAFEFVAQYWSEFDFK